MKIRNDFVTNSSSSSFILAFDKEKDYTDFCEACEYMEYDQLKDIVSRSLQNKTQEEQKDNAKELLKRYFDRNKYNKGIITANIENYPEDKSMAMLRKIWDFEKSKEYETILNELLDTDDDYQERLKRINDADIVVEIMVWDTSGGVLEWAIRNVFLESEFWRKLVLRWNIG